MIISVFYGVLYDTTLAFRGLTAAIYLIHATSYYGCSIKSPTLSYHKTYHKIALKTIDLYTCIILPHNIIHHRTSQESTTLFPQPSPNATYPECPHQSPSKSGGRHSLPNLEPLRLNSTALRPNPPKNKTPAQSPHSVEAEPDPACTFERFGTESATSAARVSPRPITRWQVGHTHAPICLSATPGCYGVSPCGRRCFGALGFHDGGCRGEGRQRIRPVENCSPKAKMVRAVPRPNRIGCHHGAHAHAVVLPLRRMKAVKR
jgi:hypothetical protein